MPSRPTEFALKEESKLTELHVEQASRPTQFMKESDQIVGEEENRASIVDKTADDLRLS